MSAPLQGATGMGHACGCSMHSTGPVPTRRAVMTGLCSALAIPAVTLLPPNLAHADAAVDERFMRIALEEARHADFPFGAVIVREGREVARGRNLGVITDDPTAHGEMIAIRRALAVNNRVRARRQHALHDRRTLRDVHGCDPVVPFRAAGVRGLDRAALDPDRPDQ